MEIADNFSEVVWSMDFDERREYLMGLARLKYEGMPYVKIGSLLGGYSGSSVSKYVKEYVGEYRQLLDDNFAKLEESLKRNDPDYDYITDKRTVLQEMCALHMGVRRSK